MSPSLRTDLERWQEATTDLRVPVYDNLSEPLATAVGEHNAKIDAVDAKLVAVHAAVAEAMDALDAGSVGDLMEVLKTSRTDRTLLLEEISQSWDSKIELCSKCLAQFKGEHEPAEANYEKVVAEVTADFEKIGSGIAAMPATGESGELQLSWLVRNRNTRTAAAYAAMQNAKARIDGATDQQRQATAGREAARRFIRRTAERLATA